MPTVYINQQAVEVGADERLNCIQAAQRAGIEIPHYCWHPALTVVASCRMCLVEIGEKKADGTVSWQPKLFPGCQTPVREGMVIATDSEKVRQAQRATLEFLLLNHPLDCPVCDQAGECYLQDYSYRYGRGYSRLNEPKNIKPDKDYIGDQITLFTDRCIMCTRCVRFTREISGTAELQVIHRGTHEEIDIFPGEPCNNKLAGNVVDLCPVGALCSKDFLYRQRVWWLKTTASVCPDCSTGCSINIDQNEDTLYRLRPRFNPHVQGHFMCDDGRFGWKYIHSPSRLTQPLLRTAAGQLEPADWDRVYAQIRTQFQTLGTKYPGSLAAVVSPWSTLEEAYLLTTWLRQLDPQARFYLGPVRIEGEDDHYPKTLPGQPREVKFTIRAEKAPNRRGIQFVLHQVGGSADYAQFLCDWQAGIIRGVYYLNADPHWRPEALPVAPSTTAPWLVLHDLLSSPLVEQAQVVLAGSAWAEKEGSFVNHSGWVQALRRALRAPGDARADGRILWELTGRRGLFQAATLRRELSAWIPACHNLSVGNLPEYGVSLVTPSVVAETETAGEAVPSPAHL
ncbi:MAG: hypothetical protein KatS3mg114_0054 [Planctomycetaceae bacterium]|nr:MAG: hypothetical protein KatS3mg114_0054 [Planctomycetaceae bacterium]